MDDVASPDKALKAAFRSRSRHEPEGAGAGRKAVLAWQEAEHKACGPATAARPLRLDAAPASASVAADLGTGAPAAAAPASGQVPGSRSGGGHASGDTTPVFDREYLSDSGDSDDDTGPVAEQLETQAGEWSRSVASACTTFRHARSGSEKQVTALQQALAALGSACALAAALQPGDEASQ